MSNRHLVGLCLTFVALAVAVRPPVQSGSGGGAFWSVPPEELRAALETALESASHDRLALLREPRVPLPPDDRLPEFSQLEAWPTTARVSRPVAAFAAREDSVREPVAAAPETFGKGEPTRAEPEVAEPEVAEPQLTTHPDEEAAQDEETRALDADDEHEESAAEAAETAELAPLNGWASPEALFAWFDRLSDQEASRAWADRSRGLVEELLSDRAHEPIRTAELLNELRDQVQAADAVIAGVGESPLAVELRRARHALSRRVDLWSHLQQLQSQVGSELPSGRPDGTRLRARVEAVEAMTRRTDTEWRLALRQWQDHLLLKELRALTTGEGEPTAAERAIAQTVLYRLDSPRLEPIQRRFTQQPELVALREELRHWAAAPVELDGLSADLEEYESRGSLADPRSVGRRMYRLSFSPDESRRALAARLAQHYRMPNVRLYVTRALVQRLLPKPETLDQAVNDTVLNVPVWGRSQTDTRLLARFVPSSERLQFSLVATGNVAAWTTSASGPATLQNSSSTSFRVEKDLEFATQGIRASAAEASAESFSQLRDVSTGFDGLPIFGALVEGIVRDRYEESRWAAKQEVEGKVRTQVEQRVNQAIDKELTRLNDKWTSEVLAPIKALSLGPDVVGRTTTADHLILRLRLADGEHLAAHTPRPADPPVSHACLQLHESAINNFLRQLNLEGRAFSLPELRDYIATRLGRKPAADAPELPAEIRVQFAERDAVQVLFRDGSLVVLVNFAEFDRDGDIWNDFQARVTLRLNHNTQPLSLERDGSVSFIGLPGGARGQITLRTVFAKLFPAAKSWPLWPEKLAARPGLQGIGVCQAVLDDGWLSVAWGPVAPAPAPAAATGRKPVPTTTAR